MPPGLPTRHGTEEILTRCVTVRDHLYVVTSIFTYGSLSFPVSRQEGKGANMKVKVQQRVRAAKVTFLQDVTCTHQYRSEKTGVVQTIGKGSQCGNVHGHRTGCRVTTYTDGTVRIDINTKDAGPEFWTGIPVTAIEVVEA